MKLIINNLSELSAVAMQIIEFSKGCNIWLFYGDMGAGKTTLIKSICYQLGSKDNISSPTFSLVNEYKLASEDDIYHFDFYRIESELEAIDIGCDEYFYSNKLCLIEWPEKIPSLIPFKNIEISIKLVGENQREVHLIKND